MYDHEECTCGSRVKICYPFDQKISSFELYSIPSRREAAGTYIYIAYSYDQDAIDKANGISLSCEATDESLLEWFEDDLLFFLSFPSWLSSWSNARIASN